MSQLEIVTPLHHIWEVISSWIDTERLRAVMLLIRPILCYSIPVCSFCWQWRFSSSTGCPADGREQEWYVSYSSLYFYYKSSAECCFILLGVCLSDYLLGITSVMCANCILRRCIVAVKCDSQYRYAGLFQVSQSYILHIRFDRWHSILMPST